MDIKEIISSILTLAGLMATIAAPILALMGRKKSATAVQDLGTAFMSVEDKLKRALDVDTVSPAGRLQLDLIGEQVSSYTNLTKREAADRAAQLINDRVICEKGFEIELRPDGKIAVDMTPFAKQKLRKLGKFFKKI